MHYFILIFVGSVIGLMIQQSLAAFVVGAMFGWLGALGLRLKATVDKQELAIKALTAQLRLLSEKQDQSQSKVAENALARSEADITANLKTPQSERVEVEPSPSESANLDLNLPSDESLQAAKSSVVAPPSPAPSTSPASKAARPYVPAEPNFLELLINKAANKIGKIVLDYFTTGNVMVRVGVLILFFGVAFLLKYAAERTVIPLSLRYVGLMAAALAMFVFGWRLRLKNPQYALVLQGGAVGVLYLLVFAAYQLHSLVSPALAMLLLLALVVFAAVIAIVQNAMWLAAMGVTGGFLAPILASSGAGSHVTLFSYYLILNLGIALIAFYRSWRLLNWLGFAFTFGIGTLWGAKFYQAEYFASTEPFLLSFFVLYTLIALLFAIKQPPNLKGLVDGTLVFGTPVGFMALQAQLAEGYQGWPYMLALSSLLLGLVYLALAWVVRRRQGLQLLCESYLALALAFLTLTIPLTFDGRVTSSVWAIEGLALIWVGLRQNRWLSRLGGLGLMLVAAVFYGDALGAVHPSLFVLNADFVGSLLVALAALVAARFYRQGQAVLRKPEKHVALALLLWGFLWWFAGGLREIDRHFNGLQALLGYELFIAVTAVGCWLVCQQIRNSSASQARALFVLGLVSVLVGVLCLLSFQAVEQTRLVLLNMNFVSATVLSALCLWMSVYAWSKNFASSFANVRVVTLILLWLGTLLLLGFASADLHQHLGEGYAHSLFALSGTGLLASYLALHRRLAWDDLTQPVLLNLPLLAVTLLAYAENHSHLYAFYGWLIFPAVIAALYVSLRYLERIRAYPLGYLHVAAILVLTLAFSWQIAQWLREFLGDMAANWVLASWAVVWSGLLILLRRYRHLAWPMQAHGEALGVVLPRIVLGLLALWVLASNLSAPAQGGGLYLPILNPIDLANLMALAMLVLWLNRYDRDFLPAIFQFKTNLAVNLFVPAALGFLWINAALLRAFHYLLDIPFRLEPMFRSLAVESGLSILWATIALLVMVIATRRGVRSLWMVGVALMGVVILKLFFVDMAGSGSIARIVSFLSVAGLCLVVGYLAPVPPRLANQEADSETPDPG